MEFSEGRIDMERGVWVKSNEVGERIEVVRGVRVGGRPLVRSVPRDGTPPGPSSSPAEAAAAPPALPPAEGHRFKLDIRWVTLRLFAVEVDWWALCVP